MDEFEQLKQTGDWSAHPWWERSDRQVYSPYTKDRIDASFTILKRHFDSTWAKELATNPRNSFIFPSLCIGGSTIAIKIVVDLGEMLGRLETSEGLERVVIDLKGNKEESAFLELETAYAFACSGYNIRFPKEGQTKSPDIVATLGDLSFAIECKRLQSEAWESWERELTMNILRSLPDKKNDKEIVVDVALDTRLTQIRVTDKEETLNKAFLETITSYVLHFISSAVQSNELPIEAEIEELARVRVSYKDHDTYSGVRGMERMSAPLTRRIMQNGVIRAWEQLPNDVAGVAIIYSNTCPTPAFFKLFFEAACKAQPQRFSNLLAVVICSLQTLFQRTKPVFFLNPYSRFSQQIENVAHVITTKFDGILIKD